MHQRIVGSDASVDGKQLRVTSVAVTERFFERRTKRGNRWVGYDFFHGKPIQEELQPVVSTLRVAAVRGVENRANG
jgi:hypothetical protein